MCTEDGLGGVSCADEEAEVENVPTFMSAGRLGELLTFLFTAAAAVTTELEYTINERSTAWVDLCKPQVSMAQPRAYSGVNHECIVRLAGHSLVSSPGGWVSDTAQVQSWWSVGLRDSSDL